MKLAANIQSLYVPVQPTIKPADNQVTYQEFLPDLRLQTYVYCYWQLQTTQALDQQFNYRVVADGCIDIFFELSKPEENFVMGFCKKYTEFPLANSFNYIGIRFLPTMFPQLFGINAAELSNRFEQLSQVVPKTADFISTSFGPSDDTSSIKTKFDEYLLHQLSTSSFNTDVRLYQAIDLILKNFGVVDVEKDLDTGISARQLRRLFAFYIGDTAKTFSKVVRFQNILRAKPSLQSLRQNKLFFDTGYYDQAHFIKDFKNFYGVTPSRAFRK